jgi:hypothetical protein
MIEDATADNGDFSSELDIITQINTGMAVNFWQQYESEVLPHLGTAGNEQGVAVDSGDEGGENGADDKVSLVEKAEYRLQRSGGNASAAEDAPSDAARKTEKGRFPPAEFKQKGVHAKRATPGNGPLLSLSVI